MKEGLKATEIFIRPKDDVIEDARAGETRPVSTGSCACGKVAKFFLPLGFVEAVYGAI